MRRVVEELKYKQEFIEFIHSTYSPIYDGFIHIIRDKTEEELSEIFDSFYKNHQKLLAVARKKLNIKVTFNTKVVASYLCSRFHGATGTIADKLCNALIPVYESRRREPFRLLEGCNYNTTSTRKFMEYYANDIVYDVVNYHRAWKYCRTVYILRYYNIDIPDILKHPILTPYNRKILYKTWNELPSFKTLDMNFQKNLREALAPVIVLDKIEGDDFDSEL